MLTGIAKEIYVKYDIRVPTKISYSVNIMLLLVFSFVLEIQI